MTSESGRRGPASLYSPPINLVERNQVYIQSMQANRGKAQTNGYTARRRSVFVTGSSVDVVEEEKLPV